MIFKKIPVAVVLTCLFAIGMAVFAFCMGVDKSYLWLSVASIVTSIALSKYAKDAFSVEDANEYETLAN